MTPEQQLRHKLRKIEALFAGGATEGLRGRLLGRSGIEALGPILQLKAGQLPTLGAVLQGQDRVGEIQLAQGLGADDRAGAPGAIDHNGGRRVRDHCLGPVG